MDKFSAYFENEVFRKRPYLTKEICIRVVKNPFKREIQPDGRIRFWGRVEEFGGKYLRVVILEDGVTIHNAFIDRGFHPKEGDKL